MCLYNSPRLLQEFETNGSHDLDKSRTSGSMKTKLKFPEQGKLPHRLHSYLVAVATVLGREVSGIGK